MGKLTHNGTAGRTYGGDPSLVHIPDQHRADVGRTVANELESTMRLLGSLGVGHDAKPATGDDPLCPGCYMIALFDAAVILAERTGQDVRELGASMAGLFTELAARGKYQPTEEMTVTHALPAPDAYRVLANIAGSTVDRHSLRGEKNTALEAFEGEAQDFFVRNHLNPAEFVGGANV
jgi:hypothetical protein